MRKLVSIICISLAVISFASCSGCSDSSSSTRYDDTPEYWQSVNREKALKDAGLKGAAEQEKRERQLKMRGGYNGSEQQKKDLEEIDKYMKENPDF